MRLSWSVIYLMALLQGVNALVRLNARGRGALLRLGLSSSDDGVDWQSSRSSSSSSSSGSSGRSFPRRPSGPGLGGGGGEGGRPARPSTQYPRQAARPPTYGGGRERYSRDLEEGNESRQRASRPPTNGGGREDVSEPRQRASRPYGGRENLSKYNRDADLDEEPRQRSALWCDADGELYEGDHLYGISTVRAALLANRRNVTELLVQEGMDVANKKDEKSASEILSLVDKQKIPIKYLPKHDLNMLSENRPHQGFVLRAAPLQFKRLDSLEKTNQIKCVLALDEVWDPQNFGALLRTCHFLGVDAVVVCAKNSAPLGPTVSKASSGAMEVMEVHSTDNMMRFLDRSVENGWQVVGAALDDSSMELSDVPVDKPTVLVLGNEGHGIRTNVLRRCTHLVKIAPGAGAGAGADDSGAVVDSLNVSVTGGILLHHLMTAAKRGKK